MKYEFPGGSDMFINKLEARKIYFFLDGTVVVKNDAWPCFYPRELAAFIEFIEERVGAGVNNDAEVELTWKCIYHPVPTRYIAQVLRYIDAAVQDNVFSKVAQDMFERKSTTERIGIGVICLNNHNLLCDGNSFLNFFVHTTIVLRWPQDTKRLWYAVHMRSKKNLTQLRGMLAEGLEIVPVGSRWRHYKGGEYLVTAIAFDEETLDFEIIYSPIEAPDIFFARWLSVWLETVAWQGATLPRFEHISD